MFGDEPGLLEVSPEPGLFVGNPTEPGLKLGLFVVTDEEEEPSHFLSLQFWQFLKL